jgi:hypothetical protein
MGEKEEYYIILSNFYSWKYYVCNNKILKMILNRDI